MISELNKIYDEIIESHAYDKVFLNGVGKAFCAGGDVREIYGKGKEEKKNRMGFFGSEYHLNRKISKLNIPHISILDGITMGGGAGISVHGSIRIATENTVFAMPEANIGFFCDVGGTYFLPRLNKRMGYYLGLTSQTIKGIDVYKAGVATHFVSTKCLKDLLYHISRMPYTANEELIPLINMYHKVSVETEHFDSVYDKLGDHIDALFKDEDFESIIKRAENSKHPFFVDMANKMKRNSPLSMKIIHESLKRGSKMNLDDCLKMEYVLAQNFMVCILYINLLHTILITLLKAGNDFYEGVRAHLIDKDRKPKWNPKSGKEITKEMVEDYFKAPYELVFE